MKPGPRMEAKPVEQDDVSFNRDLSENQTLEVKVRRKGSVC